MSLGVLFVILVPIAEIWAAIQVAQHIGWLPTIVLLVVISACGPRLVRRQGMGVWRRARHRIDEGELPGREAIDGVLLLIAGGLLTFPGFITGVMGALLLLPPVRAAMRYVAGVWLARKVRKSAAILHLPANGRTDPGGPVVTAQSHRLDPPHIDPPRRAPEDR